DLAPGQLAIVLGMKVSERFLEPSQPRNPHLGGRKSVHPGDDAHALGRRAGRKTDLLDGVGTGQDRFVHDLRGELSETIQSLGDLLRVVRHPFEALVTIQMLAAGEEPEFLLLVLGQVSSSQSRTVLGCARAYADSMRRRWACRPVSLSNP